MVNAVQAEAKGASQPYCNARMDVVDPAGIAVRITDTFRTIGGSSSTRQASRTPAGSSTSRTAV